MKLIAAKTAGFCMGVRRAVEMALDAPGKQSAPIYTFGPLIHNPQVLDLMREKGISVLERIPERGTGTVIIRAHGVAKDARRRLMEAGFNVVDATCPRVIKVQTIIDRHARQGCASIIVGDKEHPEVTGLLGYARGHGFVVESIEELAGLPRYDKAIIVAQTTQNTRFFEAVRGWAEEHVPHYKVYNTICDSTDRRQKEVQQMAGTVDALVVVGGKNSGNTQRLVEIGRADGVATYHIETEAELDLEALASAETIGITAGASTPNWIIKRVYRTLETLPFRGARTWIRTLFRLQRGLMITNVYVSIGAGCLCYAFNRLLEVPNSAPFVLIALLYVQSMHIFNNLTGIRADLYNDPERAAFYNRNKPVLTASALVAGAVGLMTALALGTGPFLILFAMSLMGLSYNLRILPARLSGGRYRGLKDIPGAKTLLIAAAWAVVTAIFPSLSATGTFTPAVATVSLAAALIVFARTAFFDVLDMQGDRIVGRGTIPILLGEARTIRLLQWVLAASVLLLAGVSAAGWTGPLGYALALCPVSMYGVLIGHQKEKVLPGIRLEFLMDTHFILAGAIGLLFAAL
ncbi:MAG: 4-hydroxy-3-methylbut-2-enyl diphosphate reductase [Desulfobacterales bacterium]|jgi:4-hydroxy-3-methylbut-2-enyl diphosphate reductase